MYLNSGSTNSEVNMSYYCHITPGRLRIKTPVIKQNPVEIKRVREMLQALHGVDDVSINALTGSIVISHLSCEIDPETILNMLEEKGYYKRSEAMEHDHGIESAMSQIAASVGKAIVGAAVGKAFEGSMLSFLTLLI
jgi:hypothetical protein